MPDTPLGTFTVTIDGDQIDLGVENHAHLTVKVQGEQSVIVDDVADKIHFPTSPKGGKRITFPYELKLFTDVPAGSGDLSEQIGYYLEIRTPLGGLVQSTFAARAADSTISLTDLTETVVTPKSDQVRLRDETRDLRDETLAARDDVTAVGYTNDGIIAGRLGDPASASVAAARALVASDLGADDNPVGAALLNVVSPRFAAVRKRTATDGPAFVTLVSGNVDQPYSTKAPAVSAVTADTDHYTVGDQGWKLTIPGPGAVNGAYVTWDFATPLEFPPADQVFAVVNIPDPDQISSVELEIHSDPTYATSGRWLRALANAADPVLKPGRNLLRWKAVAGTLTDWGRVHRVRALFYTTGGVVEPTIEHIFVQCPKKARILLTDDRGSVTFVQHALDELRELGVPVTYALDPVLMGTSVGTKNEVITWDDVAEFAAAGDSISIHSYDGAVTSTKTGPEIQIDSLKAIRELQQHGDYPGRFFRAAWTQNLAANHAAAQDLFLMYATPSGNAALDSWPPQNRYNIPRITLHGASTATIDAYFAQLRATHSLMVCYTHGIHEDGGTDMTPTEWAYFISKVREGIEEGWLEGVTFEGLFAESGGRFVQGLGLTRAEFVDPTGAVVLQELL